MDAKTPKEIIDWLEQVRQRAERADPGPWEIFLGSGEHLCTSVGYFKNDSGDVVHVCDCLTDWMLDNHCAAKDHVPNMEFIASSRQDIPDLLEWIDRLNEALGTIWGLTLSYDSFNTVEGLKSLIDDIAEIAHNRKATFGKE